MSSTTTTTQTTSQVETKVTSKLLGMRVNGKLCPSPSTIVGSNESANRHPPTGKQWKQPKKAFRPGSGLTSFEKRAKDRQLMAAVKAKEKELKDEKEAERKVSWKDDAEGEMPEADLSIHTRRDASKPSRRSGRERRRRSATRRWPRRCTRRGWRGSSARRSATSLSTPERGDSERHSGTCGTPHLTPSRQRWVTNRTTGVAVPPTPEKANPERHSQRDVFLGWFDDSGVTLFGGVFYDGMGFLELEVRSSHGRLWLARRSSADRTNGWETTNPERRRLLGRRASTTTACDNDSNILIPPSNFYTEHNQRLLSLPIHPLGIFCFHVTLFLTNFWL